MVSCNFVTCYGLHLASCIMQCLSLAQIKQNQTKSFEMVTIVSPIASHLYHTWSPKTTDSWEKEWLDFGLYGRHLHHRGSWEWSFFQQMTKIHWNTGLKCIQNMKHAWISIAKHHGRRKKGGGSVQDSIYDIESRLQYLSHIEMDGQ